MRYENEPHNTHEPPQPFVLEKAHESSEKHFKNTMKLELSTPTPQIEARIQRLRRQRVMKGADLAQLCGLTEHGILSHSTPCPSAPRRGAAAKRLRGQGYVRQTTQATHRMHSPKGRKMVFDCFQNPHPTTFMRISSHLFLKTRMDTVRGALSYATSAICA